MKNLTTATIALLSLVFLSIGCDNGGDCNINNVSYYRTMFYNAITDDDITDKEEQYQFLEPIDVILVVNGKDSLVVNHMTQATELALPMCYTQECDTVILRYSETTEDTMFVEHTNIPVFISMDCGTAMYHNITDIRHTNIFIDSVAIVHPFVDFNAHENIKLYIAE